jgi:magnesium-transporting ATPase (P-type)
MPIEDYRRLSFKLSELSQSLYAFEAEWTINSSNPSLLGLKSFLFRGSRLKNSDHVVALVVYVGAHTKTMLNSCKPENKMSSLERRVNIYIVVIFVLEIILISVEAALVYFTAI